MANTFNHNDKVVITDGGNVGIGTTSPAKKFHVQGSNLMATFRNSSTGANQYTQLEFVAGSRYAYIWLGNQNTTSWAGDGGLNIYTETGNMDFWTAATQKMRLTASGNLGIGTTAPVNKLEVKGVFAAPLTSGSAQNGIARFSQASGLGSLDIGFGDPYSWIQSRSSGNYATNYNLALNPNGGNVGIGTTAPASKLQVNVGTDQNVAINSIGGVSRISAYDDAVANSVPLIINGSDLRFHNNAAEAVRITGGNVGIGTTSPSSKLEVDVTDDTFNDIDVLRLKRTWATGSASDRAHGILFSDANSRMATIYADRTNSGSNYNSQLLFSVNSGASGTSMITPMVINNLGRVGIGTTDPGASLDVNGAANIKGTANFAPVLTLGTAGVINAVINSADEMFFNIDSDNNQTGAAFWFGHNSSQGNTASNLMIIKDSGNVGIGTTEPQAPLHVIAASTNDNALIQEWSYGSAFTDRYSLMLKQTVTSGVVRYNFSMVNNNVAYNDVLVLDRGNVGIGTTSPGAKLQINAYFTNLGGRLLTSNASGWAADGADPDVVISNSTTSTNKGALIGLALHNDSATINTYSPMIAFSRRSNSTSYNSTFAAILGQATGQGQDANWVAGDIVFSNTPVAGYMTESMRITSAGNVGIGTTAPSGARTVIKTPGVNDANEIALQLNHGDGGIIANQEVQLGFGQGDGTTSLAQIGASYEGSSFNGSLIFRTNSASLAERLRITSAGNVGIGTTAPSTRFQVNKGSSGNVASFTTGAITAGAYAGITLNSTTQGADDWYGSEIRSINVQGSPNFLNPRLAFFVQNTNTYLPADRGEKMTINGEGNVGIGTTSPAQKFVVSNGGAAGFEWVPSTGRWYRYNRSTSAYAGIYTEASEHTWSIGASEAMRLNASGNVGIGVAAPTQKLHIQGAANDGVAIMGVGTTATRGFLGLDSSNHGYLSVVSSASGGGALVKSIGTSYFNGGNVGIGTTSPEHKLDVAGRMQSDYLKIGDDTSSSSVYIYDAYTDDNSAYFHQPTALIRTDSSATGGVDEAPVSLAMFNRNGTNNTWVKLAFAAREASGSGNTVSIAGIAAQKTSGTANNWASGDLHLWTKNGATQESHLVVKSTGNVGIGTTSPGAKLHVYTPSSGTAIVVGRASGNSSIKASADADGGYLSLDSTGGATIINHYVSDNVWLVTGGGRVGIGTTSPDRKLDIEEDVSTNAVPLLRIHNTNTAWNTYGLIETGSDGATSGVRFGFWRGTGGDSGANGFVIQTGTNTNLLTTPVTRMFVANNGNVGIGTTAPDRKLHVVGAARVTDGLTVDSGSQINLDHNYSVHGYLRFNQATFGSESAFGIYGYYGIALYTRQGAAVIIRGDSGNVGIGTGNPQGPLEVYKSNSGGLGGHIILNNNSLDVGNETAILFNDSGAGSASFVRAAISSTVEGAPYLGNIKFKTGITTYGSLSTRMIITGAGNVGIGTTSPGVSLDVVGDIRSSSNLYVGANKTSGTTLIQFNNFDATLVDQDDVQNIIQMNGRYWSGNAAQLIKTEIRSIKDSSNGNGGSALGFTTQTGGDAPVERMRIDKSGNVGIGTTRSESLLHLSQASAGGNGAFLFIDNPASSTLGNAAGIRFATNAGASFSGYGSFIEAVNTNAGNGAESLTFGTWNGASRGERMRITAAGNVGIGTTGPTAPLDVFGVRAGRDWSVSNRATIRLDSNGTEYPSDILFGHTAAANETGWTGAYWSLSSRGSSASNKFYFYRAGGNPTGGSEAIIMTFDPNLNVGIGTTSPSYRLSVSGADNNIVASFDHTSFVSRQVGLPGRFMVGPLGNGYPEIGYNFTTTNSTYSKIGNDTAWSINFGSGSRMSFKYAASGTGEFSFTEHMAITAAGKVGIGTTAPAAAAKLTVMGNQTFGLPGNGSNNSGRFISIEGNTDASGEGSSRVFFTEHNSSTVGMDNYGMSLGYRGGSTSVVGASGNTWTGLTQINNGEWGMFGHDNSATGVKIMQGSRSATYIAFYSSGSETMRVTGGNVGIGTTSPAYKLEVSGGAISIKGNAAGNSLRFDDSGGTSRNAIYLDTSNYLNVGNANYAGIKLYHTASAPTLSGLEGNQIAEGYGTTANGKVLAEPNAWLAVRIGTTNYVIPMYTTG